MALATTMVTTNQSPPVVPQLPLLHRPPPVQLQVQTAPLWQRAAMWCDNPTHPSIASIPPLTLFCGGAVSHCAPANPSPFPQKGHVCL
jgi:hypothetical protein